MTRFLIQYLLPLLAPSAVYVLWLWYSRNRGIETGGTPPVFTRGGFFRAILIGAVFLVASLAVLALTSGVAPDSGVYQAPYLQDGEIVGPSFQTTE